VILLSFLRVDMLKIIKNFFWSVILFAPVVASAQWSTGLEKAKSSDLPQGEVVDILLRLMNWLLSLVGVLGVIAFTISGIMYLTAAGDDSRMETAKKTMIWAVTGVIVALIGVVIVSTVDTVLGD
jgi:hypothetical protein